MKLWTAIGNRLYVISYVAEGGDKFQWYLPLVKSMIDTFKINNPQEVEKTHSTSNTLPEYYCTDQGCGYFQNKICLDCDTDTNGIPDEICIKN